MTTPTDLAVNGGTPVREKPWPQRALLGQDEKDAVIALFDAAIESGEAFGYNGPEEQAYCNEFAEYMGGGFADAVNSGSSAVYVALRAANLPPFSEVIVGPITDAGGIMPIPLMGCIPVVADAAPHQYNTSAEEIAKVITPHTSAILVAHIAGEPVDMVAVMALAEKHNLVVIEDVAQAHGAKLNGQLLGTFGKVAAFSTMSGKHHCTAAQGGVVFTRDEQTYWNARAASDRGKVNAGFPGAHGNVTASLNLNSNDLASTVGRVQLRKLDGFVARRRAAVAQLSEGMKHIKTIAIPPQLPGAEASFWFWRLQALADRMTCTKDEYCAALRAEGLAISTRYGALPHTFDWFIKQRVIGDSGFPWSSPEYKGDATRPFPTPNAIAANESLFNLHLHENWGPEEVRDTIAIFERIDEAFAK